MKRILDRYIFREIAAAWLGVTMVLLLILLTNQFAEVLGDVAKGKLPKDAVLDVIGLSAAQFLIIVIPIGLFLAVVWGAHDLLAATARSRALSPRACSIHMLQ